MTLPGQVTIETSSEGGIYLLRVAGELDLAHCAELELAFEVAARSDAELILLDIDGLEFIDSLGLKTILNFSRDQREAGDRLRMTSGTGYVAQMLHLTALDLSLPITDGGEASDPLEERTG